MAVESEFGFIGYVFVPDYEKNGEKKSAIFVHFYEIENGEGTADCEPFTAIKVVNQGDQDGMNQIRDWLQKVKIFNQGDHVNLKWRPGRGNIRYDVQDIYEKKVSNDKKGGLLK